MEALGAKNLRRAADPKQRWRYDNGSFPTSSMSLIKQLPDLRRGLRF